MAFLGLYVWCYIAAVCLLIELLWQRAYGIWPFFIAVAIGFFESVVPDPHPKVAAMYFIGLSLFFCLVWRVLRKKPLVLVPSLLSPKEHVGRQFTLVKDMILRSGNITIGDRVWRLEAQSDLVKGTPVEVYGVNGFVLKVKQISHV